MNRGTVSLGGLGIALLIVGCTDVNPDFTDDGGDDGEVASTDAQQSLDLALGSSSLDLQTALADLAGGIDLAMPPMGPGGPGAPCKVVCDCMAGLTCDLNGQCQKPPFGGGAVYCCGSMTCPPNSACQDPAGKWGQCPGAPPVDAGGGGMADAGGATGPAWCQFIPCQDDTLCKTSGCGSCNVPKGSCQ